MTTLETQLRREIVEAGRRLYEKNMVASNDGNISARLSEGELLITPTGICKGDMTQAMLLKVDLEGNILEGDRKATSEMKMHLAVYQQRPDVGAVVHAHPQKATAFAVAHLNLDEVILPEAILALGNIELAEYGTPSTEEIPRAVRQKIGTADALLLANHGALTVGKTPMDAYFNMETLEHFAAIALYARQLGGACALNEEQVKKLLQVRTQVYGKTSPFIK